MSSEVSANQLHDRILESVVRQERLHAVYPNLAGHRNVCVTVRRQEVYPDLVLCDRESFRVEHVIEVETADMPTEQRVAEWALLSRGPWRLWIIAPQSAAGQLQRLCEQHGIRALCVSWSLEEDGIHIHWPQNAPALLRPWTRP